MTEPTAALNEPAPGPASNRADTINIIKRRCADASIHVDEVNTPDGTVGLLLLLPNGREKRPVFAGSDRELERLKDCPFERYIFLGDFQAIASYSEGVIEAIVRPLNVVHLPSQTTFRRLFGLSASLSGQDSIQPHTLTSQTAPGVTMTLGPSSRDMQVLAGGRLPRSMAISLRISGLTISQHDPSTSSLERLAQSLFFEVDMRMGIPLSLFRERSPSLPVRSAAQTTETIADVQFPSHEYPAEPMALYWYARSAAGMPLLQFLAYYQCMEFFFPTYSRAEAHRRVRNLLKDPTFSATRDTDIGRLLNTLGPSAGSSFGSERSQLRATLQECLDPSDLRAFIESLNDPHTAFGKQNKSITGRTLPLATKDADLRSDVADRIYDIRCKIVHTKGDSEGEGVELLLPFSKEASLLGHDVMLAQYVARRVLISGSSPVVVN